MWEGFGGLPENLPLLMHSKAQLHVSPKYTSM